MTLYAVFAGEPRAIALAELVNPSHASVETAARRRLGRRQSCGKAGNLGVDTFLFQKPALDRIIDIEVLENGRQLHADPEWNELLRSCGARSDCAKRNGEYDRKHSAPPFHHHIALALMHVVSP